MYNVEPVVADETIYLGVQTDTSRSKGYVAAFDIETGNQQWKRTDLPAPQTPVFDDGMLYFATSVLETSDAGGFYALNAETGETEWRRAATQEWGSPVVTERHVYTLNEHGAYALDPATGSTVWRTDSVGGIANGGGGGALCYGDGTVFFADGTALNADDGSVMWRVADDKPPLGSPAVNDDMVYYIQTEYIVGDDSNVRVSARSIDDGTVNWTHESDSNGWDGQLAVTDDHALFLEENNGTTVVQALNSETGASVWTAELNGSYFSSPTVAGETVYIGGQYTPGSNRWSGRGVIYAIDLETGIRKWAYLLDSSDLETSPENPPAAGTPVMADGKLFTTTYPAGSTLDYEYVYFSNFFVLGSGDERPDFDHLLPVCAR
ncbi:outer membrane protein assembly factor BamB family protein [Haladaptatus sp. NG-SE-30]